MEPEARPEAIRQFPTEALTKARSEIRALYGSDLESKASDLFCISHGLTFREASMLSLEDASLDRAGTPSTPPAVVLEFAQSASLEGSQQATNELRESPNWRQVTEAVASLTQPDTPPLQASRLLRDLSLRLNREDFYKAAGAVRGVIEGGSQAFTSQASLAVNTPTPARVSEVCWLNRTIRTWADLRLLAELASDRGIERFDVSRRLQAEVSMPGTASKVPEFRQKYDRTGKGIIVAVIDSEVAFQHPALLNRVIQKRNYSSEPWGNPGEHGTAVAGIIAADSPQFMGIAPDATIYNYKVLATNRFLNGDNFYGGLALQQALEDGAHIANCSWGVGPAINPQSRLAQACNKAWQLGLTIVKSAGNEGPDPGSLTSPAEADGILVVGATDENGIAVQDYSSRGPLGATQHRPHLVAVGGTSLRGVNSCTVNGGFGDVGFGTSFAAPQVAGIIALLLEADIELEPEQLRTKLLELCQPLTPHNLDVDGEGFLFLS